MKILPIDSYANKLYVLSAPTRRAIGMLEIAAYLALQGPLRVIDGGNHFNVLKISRILRKSTPQVEYFLARIAISRAFTCHQMEAMIATASESPPVTLIIDLLNTFYDESVTEIESHALLTASLGHLKRICIQAPVIVSVGPNPKPDNRIALLSDLLDVATHAWQLELSPAKVLQPSLWC